jgi:uncharacterized protein YPO0396
MSVPIRVLPLVLAGVLVLTGCRTYGNEKYETGPKTYQSIQETVEQMEQDLGRARADLRRLESAAETMAALEPLATRYQSYVQSHEAALAGHRDQAERLSPESSYRSLHRIYGAMITDRRLLDTKYDRVVRTVWAMVRDTTIPRKRAQDPSRYVITPVNFPRVRQRGDITMADALRALEGTPGLQRDEAGGAE